MLELVTYSNSKVCHIHTSWNVECVISINLAAYVIPAVIGTVFPGIRHGVKELVILTVRVGVDVRDTRREVGMDARKTLRGVGCEGA